MNTKIITISLIASVMTVFACNHSEKCDNCTDNVNLTSTGIVTEIQTVTYSDISTSSTSLENTSSSQSSTIEIPDSSSGEDSETPFSSSGIIEEYCGDGIKQSNENCDNGIQNKLYDEAIKGDCTVDCNVAFCGDFILNKDEQCDGEKLCNECILCGNSLKEGSEECDDGNATVLDGCNECKIEHVAFVSSEPFTGNLGGITGANQKCQQLANDSFKFGDLKFRAWIADNKFSPYNSFSPDIRNFKGIIRKSNEDIFVDNGWDDLKQDMLYNALNHDEYGNYIDIFDPEDLPFVWSNVGAPPDQQNYCKNGNVSWSSENGIGNIGSVGVTNDQWTFLSELKDLNEIKCSKQHRLYCISQ